LAVLVLAALTLVTIDARSNGSGVLSTVRSKVSDGFSPLQRATHAALQPIGNFLSGALNYGSLRNENQRLRDQVAALQSQSLQAAAEEAAAQQVLAEQDLTFLKGIPTKAVEVIDNGFSNFDSSVTINRGTADGITAGEPVVAAGGLVGSVLLASAHTATVVLLTAPTFSVGVQLQGGNIGSAEGVGQSQPLRVTVETTAATPPKMTRGETVVTSGLDLEKFPANIPVGRVASVSTAAGASEPDITVTPMVHLGQLLYMQVLLWTPP
jgi:rod shape-determining protein MreC